MFYFNGQRGFSGAQEVDAFVKVFDVIAKKFPASADQSAGADSWGDAAPWPMPKTFSNE